MKRIIYILILALWTASCTDFRQENPYADDLHTLTVRTEWPSQEHKKSGLEVRVEEMNIGSRYVSYTDPQGCATFAIPDGLYRITISGREDTDVFNGSADKVVLSGKDIETSLKLSVSKAGSIVIKEIYCGGCKKLPEEGNYQTDQYIILHNNDYNVQYLDSLCFGTLAPYRSTGSNPWGILPDFVPVIQAVWQFPGDGNDFPLQPGEDAVLCLRGAIDHAAQYPLSVNLNKPDYFVCYNPTYFSNTSYHPAPGDLISQDRYLDVVVKTGKANAYTMSVQSPAVVIFRSQGVSIQDFVDVTDNITPVPGSSVDNVVKVPYEWILDAVEVFEGSSSNNQKRLQSSVDAGYVMLSDTFLGHSLIRLVDEEATAASGYEILRDTNNSLNDFYESERQSLYE